MNDMSAAIIPKSDQWNYDDFQTGSMTFKIVGVKVKPGTEQPVDISLAGTEKFYRPCKSMARILVAAWGADSLQYVGRSFTLYGDPKVRWGGMEVGGIRISHMSDLPEAMTMHLTATKGNKKPFTVRPLEPERDWGAELAAADSMEALVAIWSICPDKRKYTEIKNGRKAALDIKNAAT